MHSAVKIQNTVYMLNQPGGRGARGGRRPGDQLICVYAGSADVGSGRISRRAAPANTGFYRLPQRPSSSYWTTQQGPHDFTQPVHTPWT